MLSPTIGAAQEYGYRVDEQRKAIEYPLIQVLVERGKEPVYPLTPDRGAGINFGGFSYFVDGCWMRDDW